MDIAWWRDLVIVLWGLITTIAVVVIAVIAILFYKKLSTLLETADNVVAKAGDVLDYTKEEILQPVIQWGNIIQGIVKGAGIISKLFKRKEDKDE